MDSVLVVGASGHGKVVLDIIEQEGRYAIEGLIDEKKESGRTWFGYEILGPLQILEKICSKKPCTGIVVAIGDNSTRQRVVQQITLLVKQPKFVSVIHPSVILARGAVVGVGSVIMAGAIVGVESVVGSHCIINTHASLDHDGVVEDFASLGPRVVTGGNTVIGFGSAIGIGATILHGRCIGKDVVVGAGALITKDLPPCVVAYGVPARIIRSRKSEDPYL